MSIENLAQQFATTSAQVVELATAAKANATAIGNLEAGVDDITERLAALTVMGNGGDQPAGNRKAEMKALAGFVRSGNDGALKQIHATAGMSTDSDPDGGYFVMPALSSAMTKKLHDAVTMRRLARVETITAGSSWKEPLDTGDVEAVWVGERQPRLESETPEIGMLDVPLREIYANAPVTQNLLDDVGFDLGGWVEGKISDKFARSEDSKFLSGDGVVVPHGFLDYPTAATADASRPWGTLQHIITGAAADFPTSNQGDVLKSLVWSLRAPYRQGATWLLNSNTMSVIDKFKDGIGNYLLRPSMTAGSPNELLGYPIEISESMPDVGAGTKPIAFGNWKLGYVIVDRVGVKFLRDPYTAKPHVMFYAYKRVGGAVANSEAIKLLKVSAP